MKEFGARVVQEAYVQAFRAIRRFRGDSTIATWLYRKPAPLQSRSLSYRRGLDRFVVTTRRARVTGEPHEWSDPLATGEGFVDDPERLVLGRGALEGLRAELVVVPRAIPHVWARSGELVVTVAGALSRAELVRVTESL